MFMSENSSMNELKSIENSCLDKAAKFTVASSDAKDSDETKSVD